jgi:hypothetical protein
MGAWGAGSFENDDASDWAWELEELGLEAIETAFTAVTKTGEGYLEAPDGSYAIAAAEVVAALRGRASSGDLPEEVETFVAARPEIDDELLQLARKALSRVLADNSELRDLWKESDSFAEWKGLVTDLQTRLED